jgi:PAS domain-containing protein
MLLESYREPLTAGTAGFAEVYYNFLFDNPDIADVLYSYERGGGDVGMLVRKQLENILASIAGTAASNRESDLVAAGGDLFENCFRPVWVIASYNLLTNYMIKLLAEMVIPATDRTILESVITTVLLRDMGLTMEGFWRASHGIASKELAHVVEELGTVEDLLSGIPHYVWSVDVKSNKVIYANYPLQSLFTDTLEAPIPCLADTHGDDQQQLLNSWQNAVSGSHSYAEIRMSLAGGAEHWYRISLFPSLNRLGKPVLMHCILEDINHLISERKLLERMATTDRLTNLPNRA